MPQETETLNKPTGTCTAALSLLISISFPFLKKKQNYISSSVKKKKKKKKVQLSGIHCKFVSVNFFYFAFLFRRKRVGFSETEKKKIDTQGTVSLSNTVPYLRSVENHKEHLFTAAVTGNECLCGFIMETAPGAAPVI